MDRHLFCDMHVHESQTIRKLSADNLDKEMLKVENTENSPGLLENAHQVYCKIHTSKYQFISHTDTQTESTHTVKTTPSEHVRICVYVCIHIDSQICIYVHISKHMYLYIF